MFSIHVSRLFWDSSLTQLKKRKKNPCHKDSETSVGVNRVAESESDLLLSRFALAFVWHWIFEKQWIFPLCTFLSSVRHGGIRMWTNANVDLYEVFAAKVSSSSDWWSERQVIPKVEWGGKRQEWDLLVGLYLAQKLELAQPTSVTFSLANRFTNILKKQNRMTHSKVIRGRVSRESLKSTRFSSKLGITDDLMCSVLGKTGCFRREQGHSLENTCFFPKTKHIRSPVIPSFEKNRVFSRLSRDTLLRITSGWVIQFRSYSKCSCID